MFFKLNYFYTSHCSYREKRSDFSVNFPTGLKLRLTQRKSWVIKGKFKKFSQFLKLAKSYDGKSLKMLWKSWNIEYKNLCLHKLLFNPHCVKSVQIWSFFWSVFFKYRKNSVFGHISRSAAALYGTTSDVATQVAATDTRYFAKSKFSRSLVHKKNFGWIW